MADLRYGRLHRITASASRSSCVGSIIITSGDELSSKTPSLESILPYRTPRRHEKGATKRLLFHFRWLLKLLLFGRKFLRRRIFVFENTIEHFRAFRAPYRQLRVRLRLRASQLEKLVGNMKRSKNGNFQRVNRKGAG